MEVGPMSETLFPVPDGGGKEPAATKRPAVRLVYADRRQVQLRPSDLESLLSEDHRARVVWQFVSKLDLTAFHERVASREGQGGRPAFDPAVLLTLWIYATLEAVGSARALERLCEEHDAYRWICGGLTINHHTLSDFRVGRAKEIDELLTKVVGSLLSAGAVTMERVAQDGMKVRASAGAPSFRRKESLEKCLKEAREQVETLRKELDAEPLATDRRQRAARERAAREREERVADALRQWNDVAERRTGSQEDREAKARVSTTDPDARVMKGGDGGFRPSFNAQFATDTKTQVIVGVTLTNSGGDMGQLEPMLDDLKRRYDRLPKEHLVDAGYSKPPAIEAAATRGVDVFTPIRKLDKDSQKRAQDGPGVKAWIARMETEDGKATYAERPATAECVNAITRNRGLRAFLVRGMTRCLPVLTLFALAHNVMRSVELLAATN
jgi:transposase